MEFLAPFMLLGALGIAVPIAIHLSGRRKATIVSFAAVDFLLGSDKRVARFLRLRDWLVLLVRALMCLALALILSKPFAYCSGENPGASRGPQAAVLVLDNSLASRYQIDGTPLLERIKTRALAILTNLGPEAEIAIVLVDHPQKPVDLSRNHLALREQIKALAPSYQRARIDEALHRARDLLTTSNHLQRSVFLLSPVSATGVPSPDFRWAGPNLPELHLYDPSDGQTLNNAAIVDVQIEADGSTSNRGIGITVSVENFGTNPLVDRQVTLFVENTAVARGTVTVAPGGRTAKRLSATLPAGVRVASLRVELQPDALADDDHRVAVAIRDAQVPVLLVNGDPRSSRHEDEVFYLSAALRPGDRGDSGTELTTTGRDELAGLELLPFNVIVLANVTSLPAASVSKLSAWVKTGGGLLVTLGDNVSAEHYNATMSPLLPQALRTPLDTAHGQDDSGSPGLRFGKIESDHAVFTIFGGDNTALIESRFRKIMLLGPRVSQDERSVLARYDNGAVALVEARNGQGRVMLLTSSIDRDWNDLPIQPGFLPLMQECVRYLARKPQQKRQHSLIAGSEARIAVGSSDQRIEVEGPNGRRVFEGEQLTERNRVVFADTNTPGYYQVRVTDAAGRTTERRDESFAVVIEPAASDLRRFDIQKLRDPAPANQTEASAVDPEKKGKRVELWHAIALGLLLTLLIETLLSLPRRLPKLL